MVDTPCTRIGAAPSDAACITIAPASVVAPGQHPRPCRAGAAPTVCREDNPASGVRPVAFDGATTAEVGNVDLDLLRPLTGPVYSEEQRHERARIMARPARSFTPSFS